MLRSRKANGWGAGQEEDAVSESIIFQCQTRFHYWLQMPTNPFHLKKFYNLPVTVLHVAIWQSLGNHGSAGWVGRGWDSRTTDRMTSFAEGFGGRE